MIIVTGTAVAASDDALPALMAASLEHVQRSRTEPGCLSHAVHQDVENPRRLVFLERWADLDALRAHFAVPASGAFVTAVRRLTTEAPTMEIYSAEVASP